MNTILVMDKYMEDMPYMILQTKLTKEEVDDIIMYTKLEYHDSYNTENLKDELYNADENIIIIEDFNVSLF